MNVYQIKFQDNYVVQVRTYDEIERVADILGKVKGLRAVGGSILNPKSYFSITEREDTGLVTRKLVDIIVE